MLLRTSSASRRDLTRPAIAVGAFALVLMTALGNIPTSSEEPGGAGATLPLESESVVVEGGGLTFADYFNDQGRDMPSTGEGQGVVALAPTEASADPLDPSPGGASGPGLPDPPASLPEVQPILPSLLLTGVDASVAGQVESLEGVAEAAAATVGVVRLQVPEGEREVTLAAVDPEAYRPLAPEITAAEPAVWQRLIAGDAAFTHDAGNRLTVPLGSEVTVTGDPLPLRIGVFASNGIPPIADGIVSEQRGAIMGLGGETRVYIAVAEGVPEQDVIDAVAAAVGVAPEPLAPPQTNRAFLTGSDARNFFEPFDYIDHGDGLITIDPAWVARNIETRMLPIFQGPVTCHRQMLIQLEGALREVELAGLAPLIDVRDYGGCWVARHIDWRPDRPISMHGWGLAVDFNVQTNQLGAAPTMDPRIVEIFDRWGFVWGGRWSRPDGMHFELGAVLEAPPVPGQ